MSNTISGFASVALPNTLDNENIIETALSGYLPLDGSSAMEGDLDMGTHNIKNLASATTNDEAVNLGQLNTSLNNYVTLNTNQVISGVKTFYNSTTGESFIILKRTATNDNRTINFNNVSNITNWSIGNLGDATEDFNIYKGSSTPILTINNASPSLSLNNYRIINLQDPILSQDGATKNYVDTHTSGNYVDLTNFQIISGQKLFYKVLSGYSLGFQRDNNTYGLLTTYTNLLSVVNEWLIGQNTNSSDYTFFKTGYDPVLSLEYSTKFINCNSNRVVNMANAVNTNDAVNLGQLNTSLSNLVTTNTSQQITGLKLFRSTVANPTGGTLILRNLTTAENTSTYLLFKNGVTANSANGHQASIVSGHTTLGRTYISFRTNATTFSNVDVEAMRIDPFGNLGIGTISPTQKLDVNGTSIFRGELSMNTTNKIINVANPVFAQDVATKDYVDKHNNVAVLKTANFIYNANDDFVVAYLVGGAITCTIPSLSTLPAGWRFRIAKAGNTTLNLILANFPTDQWTTGGALKIISSLGSELIDFTVDNINGSGTNILMAFRPTLL
jgi:hypothetical protein